MPFFPEPSQRPAANKATLGRDRASGLRALRTYAASPYSSAGWGFEKLCDCPENPDQDCVHRYVDELDAGGSAPGQGAPGPTPG